MNETLGQPSNLLDPRGSKDGREQERDEELLERFLGGDETAFRALFERYHQRLYAVVCGIVKNPQDASDVVQDVFVRLHQNAAGFRGGSKFYTWLYRIGMNVAIDHLRKSQRLRKLGHEEFDESKAGTIDESFTSQFADTPDRRALRKELQDAIADALQELPEHHRATLLLREVEGLSYEEIAEITEVPRGTVMSRLFHARRKMQESLSPYLKGDITVVDET